MTLKELLDCFDFKDIAPIIADMSPECKSALPHYKETFDILRHLTPKERAEIPEDIRQWICPYIRFFPRIDPETGERTAPFGAFDCEGDAWDECLSREIVVSDELTLNDNEIVAHCLWSLTFYGFNQHTEEGVEETFHYVTGGRYLNDNWQNWRNRIKHYKSVRLFSLKRHAITRKTEHTNPYEVAAKNLEEKINRHNSSKENRSKRMRKRRQERHFKKLVRMARVENAIRSLTRDIQSFSREELMKWLSVPPRWLSVLQLSKFLCELRGFVGNFVSHKAAKNTNLKKTKKNSCITK